MNKSLINSVSRVISQIDERQLVPTLWSDHGARQRAERLKVGLHLPKCAFDQHWKRINNRFASNSTNLPTPEQKYPSGRIVGLSIDNEEAHENSPNGGADKREKQNENPADFLPTRQTQSIEPTAGIPVCVCDAWVTGDVSVSRCWDAVSADLSHRPLFICIGPGSADRVPAADPIIGNVSSLHQAAEAKWQLPPETIGRILLIQVRTQPGLSVTSAPPSPLAYRPAHLVRLLTRHRRPTTALDWLQNFQLLSCFRSRHTHTRPLLARTQTHSGREREKPGCCIDYRILPVECGA